MTSLGFLLFSVRGSIAKRVTMTSKTKRSSRSASAKTVSVFPSILSAPFLPIDLIDLILHNAIVQILILKSLFEDIFRK